MTHASMDAVSSVMLRCLHFASVFGSAVPNGYERCSCYVAAKATYIRLLHGKMGFFGGFFGPSSVKWGRTHIVLG